MVKPSENKKCFVNWNQTLTLPLPALIPVQFWPVFIIYCHFRAVHSIHVLLRICPSVLPVLLIGKLTVKLQFFFNASSRDARTGNVICANSDVDNIFFHVCLLLHWVTSLFELMLVIQSPVLWRHYDSQLADVTCLFRRQSFVRPVALQCT